jgi:hypothetical protein
MTEARRTLRRRRFPSRTGHTPPLQSLTPYGRVEGEEETARKVKDAEEVTAERGGGFTCILPGGVGPKNDCFRCLLTE